MKGVKIFLAPFFYYGAKMVVKTAKLSGLRLREAHHAPLFRSLIGNYYYFDPILKKMKDLLYINNYFRYNIYRMKQSIRLWGRKYPQPSIGKSYYVVRYSHWNGENDDLHREPVTLQRGVRWKQPDQQYLLA